MPKVRVLAHPIAVAADIDDVTVMHEAVDECCGHDLVAQDLTPFLKTFVGREDGRRVQSGRDRVESSGYRFYRRNESVGCPRLAEQLCSGSEVLTGSSPSRVPDR